MLGLILVSLATFVCVFVANMLFTFAGAIVANVVLVWFPPGLFGFWVGLRRMNPRFKSQVIPFGLLVGLAVSLGRLGQIVALGAYYFGGKPYRRQRVKAWHTGVLNWFYRAQNRALVIVFDATAGAFQRIDNSESPR